MGNGTHGQRGIMVNTDNRDGSPWGIGHMDYGAHGQWDTWAKGIVVNTEDRDGGP